MKRTLILSVLSISMFALTACETGPRWRDAQFWQREDATSALYLQGPKAQQTLHQDISACVSSVNELERLGSIKEAVPGHLDNPYEEGDLSRWDTPNKDGVRYSEHLDYVDFETCMRSKGWERVEHLPYDVSERARDNWVHTINDGETDRKAAVTGGTKTNISANDREPYDNLND